MRSSVETACIVAVLLIAQIGVADDDPMRPYQHPVVNPAAAAPRYIVQAILVSSERRVAVVNGERVSEGDSIGNAQVKSIEARELTLEINGKPVVLSVASATE